MNEKALGPDSSIKEIFDAIMPESGMKVIPTEVPGPEGRSCLAILIAGKSEDANVLMANLMSYVQEMHDVAQQKAAEEMPDDEQPAIIVP